MKKYPLEKLLRFGAIFGNIYFAYWIMYKAIDEGFRGTPNEIVSGIVLFLLLALNAALLYLQRDRSRTS